jgi:riboflavin synthase
VTNVRGKFLEFDLSAETLKKTTLRDLKINDRVNLESALTLSKKLGGHMVSGHVDGVGEIRNIVKAGNSFDFYISIPSELLCYLAPKGSIALEGVSLTTADFRQGLVVIAVIPLTLKATTLGSKKIGDKVNIEVDILSKYVEKHLAKGAPGISEEMLTRVGLMPMGWIEN